MGQSIMDKGGANGWNSLQILCVYGLEKFLKNETWWMMEKHRSLENYHIAPMEKFQ